MEEGEFVQPVKKAMIAGNVFEMLRGLEVPVHQQMGRGQHAAELVVAVDIAAVRFHKLCFG